MADIEVYKAETSAANERGEARVASLLVRFKGTAERTIDRDTALAWLAGGHSMITHAGSAHHATRGHAIERVEVDGVAWLRTDTRPEAGDHLEFPHPH